MSPCQVNKHADERNDETTTIGNGALSFDLIIVICRCFLLRQRWTCERRTALRRPGLSSSIHLLVATSWRKAHHCLPGHHFRPFRLLANVPSRTRGACESESHLPLWCHRAGQCMDKASHHIHPIAVLNFSATMSSVAALQTHAIAMGYCARPDAY